MEHIRCRWEEEDESFSWYYNNEVIGDPSRIVLAGDSREDKIIA